MIFKWTKTLFVLFLIFIFCIFIGLYYDIYIFSITAIILISTMLYLDYKTLIKDYKIENNKLIKRIKRERICGAISISCIMIFPIAIKISSLYFIHNELFFIIYIVITMVTTLYGYIVRKNIDNNLKNLQMQKGFR